MKAKRPIKAFITSANGFDGFDGIAVVRARTEAGAKGRTIRAAREAGFPIKAEDIDVARMAPLDGWIADKAPDCAWDLQIALWQEQDARKVELSRLLVGAIKKLREGGKGLTPDQTETLTKDLCLPWYNEVKVTP